MNTLKKTIDLTEDLEAAHKLVGLLAENFRPVLAGGATRDLLLGKQPRDYDIFVTTGTIPGSEASSAVAIVKALHSIGRTVDSVVEAYFHDYTSRAIFAINSGSLQVIAMNHGFDPVGLVSGFDMGINETWGEFNGGKLDIHATEAFGVCVSHKMLGDRGASLDRIERITTKYPEYAHASQLMTPAASDPGIPF